MKKKYFDWAPICEKCLSTSRHRKAIPLVPPFHASSPAKFPDLQRNDPSYRQGSDFWSASDTVDPRERPIITGRKKLPPLLNFAARTHKTVSFYPAFPKIPNYQLLYLNLWININLFIITFLFIFKDFPVLNFNYVLLLL